MGKYDKDGNEVQPSDRKGAIYIDNIQFVYGANTDDTDNPSIDTISANGTELNDDAVLDTNNVTFTARASDLQNKYTSGVDFTTANVWLDLSLIHIYNFGGVRFDGTNATIIGSKQGEFIADRNNIVRVWMDHGAWPYLTTRLYMQQTGDIEFLTEANTYFKMCIRDR